MATGHPRADVSDLGAEHRLVPPTHRPMAGSERRTTLSVRMAAEGAATDQGDHAGQ